MSRAFRETFSKRGGLDLEGDELPARVALSQKPSEFWLQCGTRQHNIRSNTRFNRRLPDSFQPRVSFLIAERMTRMHQRLGCVDMKIVGIEKRGLDGRCQLLADLRFSTAGRANEDDRCSP